jgi:general stress protein YciG
MSAQDPQPGEPRPDLETQDVPEDEGVLQPADTLETDDLNADPLDTGISPPERNPAAERFGVTEAEAREGETLEERMTQEQPDIPPVAPEEPEQRRSGRLVSADETSPDQFAREVGRDGGAASAEEAAVHDLPEEQTDRRAEQSPDEPGAEPEDPGR